MSAPPPAHSSLLLFNIPSYPQTGLDLSPMFKGASWQEAACLLRLLYSSPREAAPANLAVLAAAGFLPGVARLAHCLDCQRVLIAVDEFLQGGKGGRPGAGCRERDARRFSNVHLACAVPGWSHSQLGLQGSAGQQSHRFCRCTFPPVQTPWSAPGWPN